MVARKPFGRFGKFLLLLDFFIFNFDFYNQFSLEKNFREAAILLTKKTAWIGIRSGSHCFENYYFFLKFLSSQVETLFKKLRFYFYKTGKNSLKL